MSKKTRDKARDHLKYTYLEKLTSTLTNHERNLNRIIERLDVLVETISKIISEPQESSRYIKPAEEDNNGRDEKIESLLKMAKYLLADAGN